MEKAEFVKILRGISEEAYNTASGAGCRALGAKVAGYADAIETPEEKLAPVEAAVAPVVKAPEPVEETEVRDEQPEA